jgi:DNA-binding transcriptional MerR regulator
MILQAQSLGFTLDEIKGALAETSNHGLRRDYLIGQIVRKLAELDRHIAQAQELRARLVCANNELKTRLKNGANCDARPAAPLPTATVKPRPARRADRRTAAIAG